MKISIRFLLKETFGCLLNYWFMTIVCTGISLFKDINITLDFSTVHQRYRQVEKITHHIQIKNPFMISQFKKIGNISLDNTRLIVPAVLVCLISFWVVNAFLFRVNSVIYNKKVPLKKQLVTALKVTPRFLLVRLVKFLPAVVFGGFVYILDLMSLTKINEFIIIFIAVISFLVAWPVLLIRWALVDAVIINEQCCGLAALKRSWQLTKGQWCPVLGGMFLPIFLISNWLNYLFSRVYALYLYQQLTTLPTVELQQPPRVKDVHR